MRKRKAGSAEGAQVYGENAPPTRDVVKDEGGQAGLAVAPAAADTSLHVVLVTSHLHMKKGECRTTRCFERERERHHIHMTFITVRCYNYSTLLLLRLLLSWPL